MSIKHNLQGRVFGRLTVQSLNTKGHFIERPGKNKLYQPATWNCVCSCGKSKIAAVYNLLRGDVKSCGCLAGDNAIRARLVRTQGRGNIPPYAFSKGEGNFYKIHKCMKERCYQSKRHDFHNYGGRGIKVCARWKSSYRNFAMDIGPRPSRLHSIDRIDTNKDYEPGNIKWSTNKEQSNNKRTNVWLEWKGKWMTMMQVAEAEQINYHLFNKLLRVRLFALDEAVRRAKASKQKFDPRNNRAKPPTMPAFQRQNLTGKTFGYWKVLRENTQARRDRQRESKSIVPSFWVCQCVCGKIKEEVRGPVLLDGRSQSCGCQRKHTLLRQQEAQKVEDHDDFF